MKKSIVGSILGALAGIAGLLLAGHQRHDPPAPDHTAEWQHACEDIYLQELERPIDPSGAASCLDLARHGAQDGDLRAWIRGSEEYRALQERKRNPPPPEAPTIQPLRADGRILRTTDGQPWRWKGVSAFALLDRYARGENIDDVLAAYQGYNVLRVWPYVPVADWGARAWDTPDTDTIRRFVADMNGRGWYVELTLLTDDDPGRLAWAKALVPQLTQGGCPAGLLLEGGNEPTTHKAIDTAALRGVLWASGCLYASGDYEESSRAYGSYLVAHTARDGEWPRRAHDALEYYGGGGPNSPSDPAHRVPIVLDEPPKLQDVNGNRPQDWRAYFGSCALLAAGCTFHSETGKFALPPTPEEAQLAREALTAMDAFPADAPLGGYRRLDEQGRSLRTYAIGPWMVRIRPTTADAPEPGWRAIDTEGVLWRR